MALGLHLLAELQGCRCTPVLLEQAPALEAACAGLVQAAGLQQVAAAFHQFQPAGATGTLVLAESHIAIHTWPEHGLITLDVFVCHYAADNTARAEHLLAALISQFAPAWHHVQRIERGRGLQFSAPVTLPDPR